MKKISKLHRLMAVLLVLVMVIGIMPVTALAEGTGNTKAESSAPVPQPQEQSSGKTEKEEKPAAPATQPQEQDGSQTEKEEKPAAPSPQPQEQTNGQTEKENEAGNGGSDAEAESTHGSAAAEAVVKLINEIGEVKLESESRIAEARKAYDLLDAETKLLVTNAELLVAAENAIAALKAPQEESAEAAGFKFGTAEKELAPGRYVINMALMNASDISAPSMAKTCIKGGDITVSDSGEALVTVYLAPVSLGDLSDWSSQWQIYNEYNTTSGTTAAEVLSKDSDGHETAIRFKVPDNSKDGVYCSMFVTVMGMRPDAYISLDYSSVVPGGFNPGSPETDGDKQAAQSVIDLINAIGEKVSLDSQEAVKAAREAYNKLTETQRGYVTNIETLTKAENTIKDMLAAKAVDDKIAAIGNVTPDSEAKIKEARSEYEKLSPAQKELVKNLPVLTEAEKSFEEVKNDRYRFGSGKTLIMPGTHEIGVQLKKADKPSADSMATDCIKGASIEVMDSGEAYINVKLGSKKMGLITGWASNWEIFNEYNATSATTPAEVVSTDTDGNVTEIRFKLPDNSWDGVYCKMKVSGAPPFIKPQAIMLLDYTGASTPAPGPDQNETDAAAAKAVDDKIAAIGDVSLASEAKIKEARSEYEKLTPAQKELVKNLEVLKAAETKLEELKNQSKYEFGSAKTVLKPGKYSLPISMMKSGDITSPSMAGDCVKGGSIEVKENGEAIITVDLGYKDMGGMIGWATDWKIYNEYKAEGESTPAEIVSKDESGNITAVSFKLSNNSWDGVYCNLAVMVNGNPLMNPDAYLKLDFAKAGEAPVPGPDQNETDAAAAKAVDDKIAAIGDVSLASEAKIKEARSEYEKLTPAQKKLVKNLEVLKAAEAKLEELKNQSKYEFGSTKTVLKPGKYSLPISMMNSGNITSPSMAGDCVKGGSIEVKESGEAVITVDLGYKDMGSMIGWATDWKIYNEYKPDGESTPAEIVSKDDKDHVTKISFKLPNNSWDGVYCNLAVMVNGNPLMNPDAYLKLDFAKAGNTPEAKSYPVNFTAGSHGSITASVDGSEIKTGDKVEAGKKVIFTATAEEGFEVESWEGVKASGSTAAVQVSGEVNVKVNFAKSETKVYNGFSKGKNYDTFAKVSVKGEVITDVELTHDAAEKYPDSLSYAEMAKDGMKDKFIGKSSTDKTAIESIDAVTGATGTSEGFKKAVMNALGLDKTAEFEFGSAKTKLQPGVYTVPVSLKNASSHDTNSVAGGAFAPTAKLTVNDDGTAVLEAKMQNVAMGPIKDMAYNITYYKEDNYTSTEYPVDIVESIISPDDMTSAGKEVPSVISFTIPDNSFDGVYMSFTVDAMGGARPDAWLKISYSGAGEPGGDGNTYKGSAKVNQFGKYTIDAEVSVADGLITDVNISARDFESTTHIETNEAKIKQVTKGLKDAWNGMAPTQDNAEKIFKAIMKKDQPDEVLDAVSGATYSAKAVRDAVMDAFKLEYQDEIINVPVEVKPGIYQVDISYYSDVVLHSLVENQKTTATLTVNADKTMSLDFDLKSGTKKEPLYILGFNGVRTDNDRSKALTMDGCSTVMGLSSNDYSDKYFEKGTKVVNHVTFPLLGGLTDIYNTNCYLYVPVMNNLDGELSGVHFDHGKFNVEVFAKVFWDSMKKIDDVPMPKPPENSNDIHNLADGSYIVNGTLYKTDKATVSMADQGIGHQILLSVSGGSYTLTLDFGSINFAGQKGYLGNLSYYLSGYAVGGGGKPLGAMAPGRVQSYQTYTDGTRVEDEFGTDYPDRVSFEMIPEAKDDGYVPLQVFVPIMDSITPGSGYQDVYLKLDLDSIRPGNPGGSANDNVLPQDALDVTDKDTGIRVKADKGVFEEKVKLVVREILSGKQHDDAAELLKDTGTAFKLYDVSFENEKGEKVQPKGKVTVYYPVPDDFDEKELALYNIKDDGTKSLVKGSFKDGYYVAVQKHFSTYALVDTATAVKDKEEAKPESEVKSTDTAAQPEKTGVSKVWIWVGVGGAVAAAAVAAFFVIKNKKHQKVK